MIDRDGNESDENLPPELERLHRELSSIHIEERASFGPELRAELEQAWSDGLEEEKRKKDEARALRPLLAAALAGLLLVGALVPQARAAVVELVNSVRAEVATLLSEPAEPELPAVVMDRPEDEAGDDEPAASEAAPRAPEPTGESGPANVSVDVTSFPDLADRERAGTVIEVFYPDSLQEQRIGGTVGLLIRVTATGEVDQVRLRRSSGIEALDRAGLAGVKALRFRPAVREGEPVATWVQFDVDFQPSPLEEEEAPTRPPLF